MKLRITVHGVAYEVDVEVLDAGEGFPRMGAGPLPVVTPPAANGASPDRPAAAAPPAPRPHGPTPTTSPGGTVASPIAGSVLEIKCKVGDSVEKDSELLVIEAMKMGTSIAAPVSGTIKSVDVAVGDAVREGQQLITFE